MPKMEAPVAPPELTFADWTAAEGLPPALVAFVAHLHKFTPDSKGSAEKFADAVAAAKKARI